MNCEQCREMLAGYVEDLLEPQQSEMVKLHLQNCADCQAELEQTMTLHNRLVKSCTKLKDSDIETAVMDEIVRQQAFELRKTSENDKSRNFWGIVMKNRIAQLAAAAAILVAAGLAIYYFAGEGTQKCCAWGDIVRPIMDANTAQFDIIVGEEGNAPIIHDMVMGSKIRRTLEGIEGTSIIDLGTMRILTLDPQKKVAVYIDLKGLPQMPNYMDQLRDVIKMLQNSPGFVVEELGKQEIDGQILYGFKARHPKATIVIYVDPATALPVRIEQQGGQMKVICKNMLFNVPMDETQFSMDAPEGYKIENQELDLFGSTEKDFIEGLRVQAEVLNDGVFPDDVSIEYVVKTAAELKDKFEKLKMTDDEKISLGKKYQKGLMFIRFFKGEGKWIYAGKDVKLGDADTAIFWYRPAGSATYHVIYGDLTVEDVNKENLPQPADEESAEPIGYQEWDKDDFIGTMEEDLWHITSNGKIVVHSFINLTKGPRQARIMRISLPYKDAVLDSVKLGDITLMFMAAEQKGQYDVNLTIEKIKTGQTKIEFKWRPPAEHQNPENLQIELKCLIPVLEYKVFAVLDEGCGYEFPKNASDKKQRLFYKGNPEPRTGSFGVCGADIRRISEK